MKALTLSFEKKIIVYFFMVSLALIILGFITYKNARHNIKSSDLISHTHEVLYKSHQALSYAQDVETGMRGYVITGDSLFFLCNIAARKKVFDHLQKMRQLTRNNRWHLVTIDSLQKFIEYKINFSNQVIAIRNSEGYEAAAKLISTVEGKNYMDEIRNLITTIQQEENNLLVQHEKANVQNEKAFTATFFILLITGIAFLIIAFFVIRNNFIQRKKAEDQIRELNQSLEKRVEEKTREVIEKEKRISAILDNMLEGAQIISRDWRYLYVNKVMVRFMKFSKEEILGHTIMEIHPGIEQTEMFKLLEHSMKERVINELEIEFEANNSKGWFEVKIQPIPEGIFVLSIDITERKKAEEKTKTSERMLAFSQKVAHIGSWEWHIADNKIIWSNEMYRIYGLTQKELDPTYEGYLQLIHPDEKESVNRVVQQAYKKPQPFSYFHKIIRPSGEIRTLYEEGIVDVDKDGRPVKMYGIAADVTERKKAEEEIANQKKFIEEILNSLPADITVLDSNQNYTFINHHAVGDNETREWLIGKNDLDYCRLKGIDDTLALNRRSLFNEAVQTKTDTEWIDENGSEQGRSVYIFRKYHPIFENDQLKQVISYGLDVTDLKTTEIKLREAIIASQKAYKEMEQFSYMVSHDLQEPLRMVSGFLDLLKSETEELLDESAKEYITYATDGANV